MDESMARDRLPEWIAGRLDAEEAEAVAGAVARDPDLGEEARLLRALAATRAEAPEGRAERIRRAVRDDPAAAPWIAPVRAPGRRRSPRFAWALPAWGWAAAAVATVAFGTVLAVEGRRVGDDPGRTAFGTAGSPWVTDDVVVAGAPVLEDLSDEMLQALLEELGG